MAWKVLFYEAASGRKPVARFLRSLDKQARWKVSKYIELLEERGFALPSPYLEKVRGQTWALRPEFGGNEFRLFFFDGGDNNLVITHAILKRTRKIDPVEIATAEGRMDDWLLRNSPEVNDDFI